jgi:hypothetical protein
MVEYAVLLAGTSLAALGEFAHSAQLWLSRIDWQLVGITVVGLIALRIAAWAFKVR